MYLLTCLRLDDAAKEHPGDNTAAVQQYNDWAQSHYRRVSLCLQAPIAEQHCRSGTLTSFRVVQGSGARSLDGLGHQWQEVRRRIRLWYVDSPFLVLPIMAVSEPG